MKKVIALFLLLLISGLTIISILPTKASAFVYGLSPATTLPTATPGYVGQQMQMQTPVSTNDAGLWNWFNGRWFHINADNGTPTATPITTNTNTATSTETNTATNTVTSSSTSTATATATATQTNTPTAQGYYPNAVATYVAGLFQGIGNTFTPTPTFTPISFSAGTTVITVAYQQPSGTPGGTVSTGSWTIYPLNTIIQNDVPITVTSNTIIIPSGTYYVVNARAQAYETNNFRLRLYNTGAASAFTNAYSTTGYIVNSGTSYGDAEMSGVKFTAATSPTTIEMDYIASSNTGGSQGLGIAYGAAAVSETYGYLTMLKTN